MNVLLVDDHKEILLFFTMCLEDEGHTYATAESGEVGLSKFEAESFDLVITDFRMAGMNGLQMARKIREVRPDTPIILVTGYMEQLPEDMEDITMLLTKPIDVATFLEALEATMLIRGDG